MLIIGSKGHAMEVYQVINSKEYDGLTFYDDYNVDKESVLNRFKVIKSLDNAKKALENDSRYVLGLGNPHLRSFMAAKFDSIGGVLTSVIANTATVSHDSIIGNGVNIMHYCLVSPNVTLGRGVLLNAGCAIHHDTIVGDFSEVSPGARILGRCIIKNGVSIGALAVVLPDIEIGEDAIIGAGAVVTRNVLPRTTVKGVPAR